MLGCFEVFYLFLESFEGVVRVEFDETELRIEIAAEEVKITNVRLQIVYLVWKKWNVSRDGDE